MLAQCAETVALIIWGWAVASLVLYLYRRFVESLTTFPSGLYRTTEMWARDSALALLALVGSAALLTYITWAAFIFATR